MKNSEVNSQAPHFREELGPQHCSKGGVQGGVQEGIWLPLVSVVKDLTCCRGQCKLKSRSTVCLGFIGLKLLCSKALFFCIKKTSPVY